MYTPPSVAERVRLLAATLREVIALPIQPLILKSVIEGALNALLLWKFPSVYIWIELVAVILAEIVIVPPPMFELL